MKKLLAALVVSALFVAGALAGTLVGTISESGCGAKHVKGDAKYIACVQNCVKNGAKPVFVTENDHKVVKIENPDKVMDHLGHKVKISGELKGDTVTIDSVETAH